MIYAVTMMALGLAVFNRAARPFALVMLANAWANSLITAHPDIYVWVSASDGIAFIALAVLTIRHPAWWSFLISELAFGAVVAHAVYWTLFGFGLYYGVEYKKVLDRAFLLSALTLFMGGYDIGNLVGSAWRRLTGAPDLRRRHVYPRHKAGRKNQEGFW